MLDLLLLDDDRVFRRTLCKALISRGYNVHCVESGEDAIRLIAERRFDTAIIDMKMPGMSGFQVLKELKEIQPSLIGIILTGYGSIKDAVQTIKLGGHHYLTKPCDMGEIEEVLKKVLEDKVKNEAELISDSYHGIAGASGGIKEVISLIKRVKDMQLPVLIHGESGTGKELVARALHFDSERRNGPFIAVNCACLKPDLLENELFGHVKGAFTGASGTKDRLLKAADKGTLFIDEIGDMDPSVQASFLRFIETVIFRPLGSTREIKVDVRVVAAINKDIEAEVKAKRFRHDLYYRLNVCRINLPPLRERKDDIPLLVRHFFGSSPVAQKRPFTMTEGAMELLATHNWSGNVRELFNVLSRAAFMSKDNNITKAVIASILPAAYGRKNQDDSSLENFERNHLYEVLENNLWNISRSARLLGINRRTLQRKITRYHMAPDRN